MIMKRMVALLLLLLSSLGLVLPLISAQSGFISIDCGSTINYTDPTTGLAWSTDDGYISTGSNQVVTAHVTSDNAKQVSTARYFTRARNKNCYVLPVTFNSSYLIRAFFLYGDLDSFPSASYSFNLSIDFTVVASVRIGSSNINSAFYHEFIVASTSSQMTFCVIPVVGNAFISSLELRPLKPTMYKGIMFRSKYTKVLYRLNCGAASVDPTVRYPDDLYDRLWPSPGSSYTIDSITTTRDLGVVPAFIFDQPPVKVMQNAWTSSSFWFNWPFYNETTTSFYVSLYVVEIGTSSETDFRSMDVFLNNVKWFTGYNFSNIVDELFDANDVIVLGSANFTLKANALSTVPPLLNGAEMHAIYDTVTATTGSTDVSALNDLRQNLNLLDWTGDPCLPVAWDWLNCSITATPRVTQMKLSGYQLRGTIPASIGDLTELTDLWLDSNFITGSIPNLAALDSLRTLHLQNNSLTGSIPASLTEIPNLSELFLEGNMLSGPVPAALLNKNGLYLLVDNLSNSSGSGGSKKSSRTSEAVSGAAVGVAVVVLLIALVFFFCCQKKKKKKKKKMKTQPQSEVTVNRMGVSKISAHLDPLNRPAQAGGAGNQHVQIMRAFSQAEVQNATNNFRQKIGEGGFGPVYYGKLVTGEEVAVKVNSATSGQGSTEFSTEVNLLSRVHHRNLVSLVGFCDEADKQILIYEYMSKGTLQEHLYGKGLTKVVDWQTRLDIAVNAARGLEYLHYDCSPKIIHRDVKSNNILLNLKMLAKVADFGISKLAPDEDTSTGVSTVIRGTTGYLDPEYFSTNKLTQKSDVYAFGVVLLEIISGRAPNDKKLPETLRWNLVEYSRGMLHDGNLQGIVDPSLAGSYNIEAMWKLAELAMYCVEPLPVNRPDMRQVVRELMEAVDLENAWESAPTTFSSAGLVGFTSVLDGSTESLHSSYPSTQTSQADTTDNLNYEANGSLFTRAPSAGSDPWNKPRPR